MGHSKLLCRRWAVIHFTWVISFTWVIIGFAAFAGAVGAQQVADSSLIFSSLQRANIDDNAIWGKPETLDVAPVETYDSVVRWLGAKAPLPGEEEVARAKKLHDQLALQTTISPVTGDVRQVFDRLIKALPSRMREAGSSFDLNVVDANSDEAFTLGGGRVYVSRKWLETNLASGDAGAVDRVAFVLARQLGHLGRGHIRRMFRQQWIYEQIAPSEAGNNSTRSTTVQDGNDWVSRYRVFAQRVSQAGTDLQNLYRREDHFEADLFAIHLCRNAGFNLENCLDVIRFEAVDEDAGLLRSPTPRIGDPPVAAVKGELVAAQSLSIAQAPSASLRLRRLRLELDGRVFGEGYGLFEYQPATRTWQPVADQSLGQVKSLVVFIHGMDSSLAIFQDCVDGLVNHSSFADRRIIGFQYPGDDSLARSAKFLKREFQRVGANTETATFVCHSAGGLVLRHYVDVDGGGIEAGFFLATPHGGSNLAALQDFLEAGQFLGDLNVGFDEALSASIRDGRGQIGQDLMPDSLFISYLNSKLDRAANGLYEVYRGRVFSQTRGMFLGIAFRTAASSLNQLLDRQDEPNVGIDVARVSLKLLELPEEISSGDLCVTCKSAELAGVAKIHEVQLGHNAIPRSETVIKQIADKILLRD
jgi:hypothetical protein